MIRCSSNVRRRSHDAYCRKGARRQPVACGAHSRSPQAAMPRPREAARLATLFEQSRGELAKDPAKAKQLATVPIGALPEGANEVDLAAWTLVANVVLNLDETLSKP